MPAFDCLLVARGFSVRPFSQVCVFVARFDWFVFLLQEGFRCARIPLFIGLIVCSLQEGFRCVRVQWFVFLLREGFRRARASLDCSGCKRVFGVPTLICLFV